MRLAAQSDYRGYTLLMFEARVSEEGEPPERHWIVIAPDGINIIGAAMPTEAEARELVDSRLSSSQQPSRPDSP